MTGETAILAEDVDLARQRLATWFEKSARDLPWRRRPHRGDPYATLVSEVMLQQTRVETVVPYFEAWMDRWPTVHALAGADEHEVLKAWSGLGYYARARRLLEAARTVVHDLDGAFPTTPDELQRLPGVGPYTAAAVAAFAFGAPAVAVDGNVARVAARLAGARVDISSGPVRREMGRIIEPFVQGDPRVLTEALIELGAIVCTPSTPTCDACPLAPWCTARTDGSVDDVPVPSTPRALPTHDVVALLLERSGRVLLRRRPTAGLLGGLWGLPMAELDGGDVPAGLARLVDRMPASEPCARIRHTFTHKHWDVAVHRTDGTAPNAGEAPQGRHWRWVPPDEVGELALSTLDRRVLAAIEIVDGGGLPP